MEKKEFIANNENLSFTVEELKKIDGAKEFVIEQGIVALVSGDLARVMETVKINYPEIFK